MNKGNVKGKEKDIAGRAQRQAGEWSGDNEQQAGETEKQVEGKAENALGTGKNAGKNAAKRMDRATHDLTDRDDKNKKAA
jgi:uncharacterized protein YjbJ (UPF0337 family)